jgi:hypothetical protein
MISKNSTAGSFLALNKTKIHLISLETKEKQNLA